MSDRMDFEIVCPNDHEQTVTFGREEFEAELNCNTCDANWPRPTGTLPKFATSCRRIQTRADNCRRADNRVNACHTGTVDRKNRCPKSFASRYRRSRPTRLSWSSYYRIYCQCNQTNIIALGKRRSSRFQVDVAQRDGSLR